MTFSNSMKTLLPQIASHDPNDLLGRYARTAGTRLSRESVAGMTFLVIGAGALGNEAVKNLGLLGAGKVIVVDPDKIEISNLSRSVFFRPDDCGRSKAETLRDSLGSTFPDTHWDSQDCEIADLGYGVLSGTNLILTCVDNDLARVEAAWLALCLDIPMIDAGLGGPDYWQGRVSFFAGRRSACFCCKLSPRRRRELLSLALSTGHSCWERNANIPLPSTPTMAAIIGGLQVDFGLQCFGRFNNPEMDKIKSPTIEICLGSSPTLRKFVTPISPVCPLHDAVPQRLAALPHCRASARELLDSQSADAVDFDWPICTAARCIDCGSEYRPMRRVAWFRRRRFCAHCRSHRILENETLFSLNRNSPWVDTPLIDLGLPQHHLYALRRETMMEEQG